MEIIMKRITAIITACLMLMMCFISVPNTKVDAESTEKSIEIKFLNTLGIIDSDTAGSEACTRLAQDIPGEIAVIRLVPARKDWNDVLRQQGDIPSRKFIAETITLRELPTAQPVPMLRMADVELTSVDWLWFP